MTIEQKLEAIRISKFYDTVETIQRLLTTKEELSIFYEKLRDDLVYFAKVVRGDIIKTEVPSHHKKMFTILRDGKPFKAIVCYRSAGKTFAKTTDVLHDICHQLEPVIYMIADTEGQAVKDLIEIKQEIESNEVLAFIYGNLKGKSPWGVTQIECSNGVYVSVRGTGSAIRGTKWKNTRLTKVVMDDFESEQNTDTEPKRERLNNWIDAQVMPAGGEMGTYTVIFYGTIVNEEAMLAKADPKIDPKTGVAANKTSIFHGRYGSFLQVDITEEDPITGKQVPTWPEMRGWDYINFWKKYYEDKKRLWFFYQEYYNIPATLSNPVFNLDMVTEVNAEVKRFDRFTYLEVYDKDDVVHLSTPKKIPVNVFVGVDPSVVASADSDDTVLFTIGLTPSGKFIILDIVAEKIPIAEQATKVLQHMDKWNPTHTTIETYAYQLALYEYVLKGVRAGGKPHVVFPFKESKSKSNKYKDGLIDPVNNGRVSYLSSCPNMDKFKEQARKFSGGITPHDDTLDGFFLSICEDENMGRVLYPPFQTDVDETLKRMRLANDKRTNKKRKRNFMSR